jgi:hypothetical protein
MSWKEKDTITDAAVMALESRPVDRNKLTIRIAEGIIETLIGFPFLLENVYCLRKNWKQSAKNLRQTSTS